MLFNQNAPGNSPVISPSQAILGGGLGSSLIGFTPAGSGAEIQPAEGKFRQYISVFDFIPIVEQAGISAGTSTFDCAPAFNNAIAFASLVGSGMVFSPPGVYYFQDKLLISSPIWLVGTWGQYSNGSTKGSRLVFPDSVMSSIGSAIEVSADWVVLSGLAISGVSKVAGSNGVRTVGTSSNFCHGFQMDKCAVFGFETGYNIGQYTDHTTVKSSYLSQNTYGTTIETNNKEDIHIFDSFLDNNSFAGIHILDGATTQNLVVIRSHFGFGQYSIWMDPSSTSGGISGLTMIGCPMEACSQGFISVVTLGSVNIEGGYWIWNGTPANPAIKVVGTEYGPININVQFQNANANSPFVFQATSYSKWPISIKGSLVSISGGNFAQAMKSSNLFSTVLTPAVPGSFTFYTNNLGFDVMVYVSGGSVSRIDVGLSGSVVVTGLTSGSFLLLNGDSIRISYTSVPTWMFVYA